MGICASRADATCATFALWEKFCQRMGLDSTLEAYSDPIPVLQIFAHRYRMGIVAPSQAQVRGRTVGDAVRAMGQILSGLGLPDPRLQPNGKLDFRLSRQLSSYTFTDPPPSRVKPIPIAVLQQATATNRLLQDPFHQALADMITLGFYFLLHPGEYASSSNPDASPFRLQDVHLMLQNRRLDPSRTQRELLEAVNFVGLEFTNQKNGVRGGDNWPRPLRKSCFLPRHGRSASRSTPSPTSGPANTTTLLLLPSRTMVGHHHNESNDSPANHGRTLRGLLRPSATRHFSSLPSGVWDHGTPLCQRRHGPDPPARTLAIR
jgi:hypothetical protein